MKPRIANPASLAGASAANARHAGFTLVEVLVGLIIGLLGSLIIFQVFAISESKKRTTTAGSDAQQNGSFALHVLERTLRTAGSNIVPTNSPGNPEGIVGCNTLAYNASATPADRPGFRLAPVIIIDGGGGASDTIRVVAGNADSLSRPVLLNAAFAASDTSFNLRNTFGFNFPSLAAADLFVAVEKPGAAIPYPSCTIHQVSSAPAASGGGPLNRLSGGLNIFNKGGNYATGYSASASVYNLGPSPIATDYSVVNTAITNQLVATDLLGRTPALALVDDVVNIQAQYGIDSTSTSNVIDSWQEPTGAWDAAVLTAAQITQIKAVRLGIVIRSAILEKGTAGACDTTVVATKPRPLTADTTIVPNKIAGPVMDVSTVPNWQCMRYKTYETVIPIRNMIRSN